MRRLIIKSPSGMFIEGVSSKRNYYFFELMDIIKKAENKEGTISRKFVCLFDGEIIVDDTFNITENLQNQIEKQMNKSSAESVKHLKTLQNDVELSRQFKEFLIKYDEKLSQDGTNPYPFLLDVPKLKRICDVVYEETKEHFYLELNNTIKLIRGLFDYLVQEADLNSVQFYNFMENEKNFNKVCEYIPTKMESIDVIRIENIYPSLIEYQNLQKDLFKELPFYIPFQECMNVHYELIDDIYNEYHKRMFEANSINNVETLLEEVLRPVVKEYHANILKTLKSYNKVGV